jgi:hypothetical protein
MDKMKLMIDQLRQQDQNGNFDTPQDDPLNKYGSDPLANYGGDQSGTFDYGQHGNNGMNSFQPGFNQGFGGSGFSFGTIAFFFKAMFTKWYMAIMVPAVLAAYYLFKAIYNPFGGEKKILNHVEDFIVQHINYLVDSVETCAPKLNDMHSIKPFLDCFF